MDSLGQRIKELRTEQRLTQEQLGKILNVGKSTISQYENNINTPDKGTLQKLADFFNISVDYLLGRTNNRNSFSYTLPNDVELEKVLEQSNIKFYGEKLDEEDKQDILEFIKVAWKTIRKKKQK